ncbi:MAG: efflux RND transporter periplasmic adaptor subunit [Hylemonella sp.]|uniref:efflux RND transporter periplasmic adaptor subunit n=1 Tax=Hylemonella sp. TaxID=2066020 RepID=UPI0022C32DAE|nr:efflux RND transporter periplasmic adaptor subunit [Hylemonella sp.]MCZ8253339.1 efflux RND transporter periplasmic adaptor subunit [Hylemonella sp.]
MPSSSLTAWARGVALGLCLAPLTAAAADTAAASPAKPALTVSVVQPTSSTLPLRVSANGAVAAWQEAILGAEVAGLRIQEVHVQVGDVVRKGQLLLSFAPESVQADVALARAQLAEAQALAAEAQANAERVRALQGSGALSQQQINQYLTQEQTARARVASAQAQLDTQLLRQQQTRLVAPDDGTISARTATVGAVVGSGSELFRLIRRSRLEWRAEVTAPELERIRAGQKVQILTPAGAAWRGQVRMTAPTVDPATRKGTVYVDVLGPAKGQGAAPLRPGSYVRGEFELGATTALTLPQSAVVVRDGFSYVYRVGADQRVARLKVQTGRVVGERVEILSGVQPSERIVASGGAFLSDGDLVRVVAGAAAQ